MDEATASRTGSSSTWLTTSAAASRVVGATGDPGVSARPRRARRGAGLGAHRPRVRPVLALRVPPLQGLVARRDRVLRRDELPRGRHAQRVHRGAARGPRPRLRRHAGDRRRDGPAPERALYRDLQSEIRFGSEVHALDQTTTRSPSTTSRRAAGSRSRPTSRFARSRSRSCARSSASARSPMASGARSASSTTRPRRRCSSRCGAASGRRRTASTAGRRSPTCRSGGSTTRRPTRRRRAASCSRATRGRRTRSSGARWTSRRAWEEALRRRLVHPPPIRARC